MKTNIKLFTIAFVVAICIIYSVSYYVSGSIPSTRDDRYMVALIMSVVVSFLIIGISSSSKSDKEELLNSIMCVKDTLIEEECKKAEDELKKRV